jgi:hypothetical protein
VFVRACFTYITETYGAQAIPAYACKCIYVYFLLLHTLHEYYSTQPQAIPRACSGALTSCIYMSVPVPVPVPASVSVSVPVSCVYFYTHITRTYRFTARRQRQAILQSRNGTLTASADVRARSNTRIWLAPLTGARYVNICMYRKSPF